MITSQRWKTQGTKNKWLKFRQNVGWHPNDLKQNEQRINLYTSYDNLQMKRNQRNIDKTYIEPRMVSQWWETKETEIEPTDVSQPLETRGKND